MVARIYQIYSAFKSIGNVVLICYYRLKYLHCAMFSEAVSCIYAVISSCSVAARY
jgi:hypothetical protein